MQITKSTRIGWIGTGIMGRSMAMHILRGGYSLFVYNRTRSKAAELIDGGAVWCDSPREVALRSELVFTMVGYPSDVEETILGADGIIVTLNRGGVIVDMTTSSPTLARMIDLAACDRGIFAIDAPVSGGDTGAKNAALSIMIGGDKRVADLLLPVFNLMGKTIVYHGESGAGQYAKTVNQILIAGNMIGLCEALLFAYRCGLDLENVFRSVSTGAAGSWSLTNIAPRIIHGDFEPGFFVEHFVKDIGIALEESRRMNLSLPGLALVEQFYIAAKSKGYGKNGTQVLLRVLAELNNFDLDKKILAADSR
ncbi:MAG: NAD(P)-dependent oxidoreductase [Planctomycetaceae bacterium]|jgi:3-hydroxyisobutyrate dehydrogenase|nr:NAD(P)-dependent oxidoreductase [Planctomycetaceae bacterium]